MNNRLDNETRLQLLVYIAPVDIDTGFYVDHDDHYRWRDAKNLIDRETGEVYVCQLHDDGHVVARYRATDELVAELDDQLIAQAIVFADRIRRLYQ